jgi:hypothetical protein
MDSPDSAHWADFVQACSDTLAAWTSVQSAAVRDGDRGAAITVSYSNLLLAKLAANGGLSFISPHRFSALGYASLTYGFRLLDNLQKSFPNTPIVLSEFGYSDKTGEASSSVSIDPQTTAEQESATWLYLYRNQFAGGLKWMLNNYTNGYNVRENNFGAYDDLGRPKTTVFSTRAISEYIGDNGSAGRGDLSISAAAGDRIQYHFSGAYGVMGTAAAISAARPDLVAVRANGGQIFVYWANPPEGGISSIATVQAGLDIKLGSVFSSWDTQQKIYLAIDGQKSEVTPGSNGSLAIQADPYRMYLITPGHPAAFDPAQSKAGDQITFFPETQHNLGYGFRYYWEHNGGLAQFGYPVSEEFTEGGYTVQYFERARFEYHPEFKGTPYETELGLLGNLTTAGRSFATTSAFTNTADRLFFPETGHSLSFGFKYYWEHHGGLPIYGYPISEEFQEVNPADGKTYTVQYFERARFEYHPEFKGTQYETELGLLGKQWAAQKGWVGW